MPLSRVSLSPGVSPPPPPLFSPQHLELVLGQLQEVVEKHGGAGVLGAASRALHALCDPQLALHGRGELVRSRLADQLGDKCHRDVAEMLQVPPPPRPHTGSAPGTPGLGPWDWDGDPGTGMGIAGLARGRWSGDRGSGMGTLGQDTVPEGEDTDPEPGPPQGWGQGHGAGDRRGSGLARDSGGGPGEGAAAGGSARAGGEQGVPSAAAAAGGGAGVSPTAGPAQASSLDEEELYSLAATLRRIAALFK